MFDLDTINKLNRMSDKKAIRLLTKMTESQIDLRLSSVSQRPKRGRPRKSPKIDRDGNLI